MKTKFFIKYYMFLFSISFLIISNYSCKNSNNEKYKITINQEDTTKIKLVTNIQLIKLTFKEFNDARANTYHDKIANLLTEESLLFFDNLLDRIKYTDLSKEETLTLYEQYNILLIRGNFSKEEILNIERNDLIGYILGNLNKSEQIKEEFFSMKLSAVKINGNSAEAKVMSGQQISFLQEKNQWKINYLKQINRLETYYQSQINKIGHQEFINRFLRGKIFESSKISSMENLLKPILLRNENDTIYLDK